jgi:hypothetical protein
MGLAQVVGKPDPKWGQAITAFVVPETSAALDEDALRGALRSRFAAYRFQSESTSSSSCRPRVPPASLAAPFGAPASGAPMSRCLPQRLPRQRRDPTATPRRSSVRQIISLTHATRDAKVDVDDPKERPHAHST